MERNHPVFTLKTECQDCFKCVRQCPVKAIQVADGRAAVIPQLCISCGLCVEVCPSRAKQVRNDLGRARHLLAQHDTVVASLAPSFVSEYPDLPPRQLIAALHQLGFAAVSETALGADEVSAAVAAFLQNNPQPLALSSACPATVEFVQKYLPELSNCITPTLSPMLAHGKRLKQHFGTEAKVVFLGPCAAKKTEADRHPELVDVVLTFRDLAQWLEDERIDPEQLEISAAHRFVPSAAALGLQYPVEGGMNAALRTHLRQSAPHLLSLSGLRQIDQSLTGLDPAQLAQPVFLEMLACEGGCIAGPCRCQKHPGLLNRLEVLQQKLPEESPKQPTPAESLEETFPAVPLPALSADETELRQALRQVGKENAEDELNCGGCGYETCRALAQALLEGRAEPAMCLSFLRRTAQKKANALLRCIPSGVVIADSALKVIECNENFARLLGEDAMLAYQACPGLEGALLERLIPFADLFRSVLQTGSDNTRRTLHFGDRILTVTLFTIEPHQVIGAVLVDITQTELQREQIAQKARAVIRKNLDTVQQIACQLGENMAETEILLRSLADGFAPAIDLQGRKPLSEDNSGGDR